MTIAKKKKNATSSLHIDGEMNIYRAAELKATLLAALEQTEELEIDLAEVTEIDTAGLQILIVAKKKSLATNRTLRLVAHSSTVLDVLELYNLVAFFGDPLVLSSPMANGRP